MANDLDTKACSRCKNSVPVTEFHRESATKDGLQRWCKACCKSYVAENRDASRRTGRRHYWRKKGNPELGGELLRREGPRKRWYGLTLAQRRRLLDETPTCPLCGDPPSSRQFDIDHDHETGRIRGVLCNSCNLMLGLARNNPETLRRAALYLEKGNRDGE